jgi:hypothetical protein
LTFLSLLPQGLYFRPSLPHLLCPTHFDALHRRLTLSSSCLAFVQSSLSPQLSPKTSPPSLSAELSPVSPLPRPCVSLEVSLSPPPSSIQTLDSRATLELTFFSISIRRFSRRSLVRRTARSSSRRLFHDSFRRANCWTSEHFQLIQPL